MIFAIKNNTTTTTATALILSLDEGETINDIRRFTFIQGRRDASFFSIRAKSQWSRRETEKKLIRLPSCRPPSPPPSTLTSLSLFRNRIYSLTTCGSHKHIFLSLRRRRRRRQQQVSFDISPKLDYFYPSPFLCELYIDFIRWWRNDITNSCL